MSRVEQDTLLRTTVKRLRHLYEELDDDEVAKKFQGFIVAGALLYPRMDADSKLFEVILDNLAAVFKADDVVDDDEELPEGIDTKFLYKRYGCWEAAFGEDYERLCNEMSTAIPGVEDCYEVLRDANRKTREMIPSLIMEKAVREAFATSEAGILNLDKSANFSEEARRLIRGFDSGVGFYVEFGASLAQIKLPTYVRESLLFKILIGCIRNFGALINDVLGLNKDMKLGTTNATVVLRRVVREGISLKEAFHTEVKRLKDLSHDIPLAATKLTEAFPEEQSVGAFVKYVLEFSDGQIYANMLGSQLKNRYGFIKMEIVPQDNQ